MTDADIGSVVVTEQGKVVGILTERDLLRAAAASAGPEDEAVALWMTAHPDVLSPDEKGRCGLVQPDGSSLPASAGGRRGLAHGCGLPARSHGPGPDPAGGRKQHRGPRRTRGRRGGRDDGGRRAGPGGLLPLPAVLRRRSGRDAFAGRRVAPHVPGGAARACGLGHFRRRGPEPPTPPAGTRVPSPCARAAWCTARGAAQCRLRPGRGTALAPDPGPRCRRAQRPSPRVVRRGSDDPGCCGQAPNRSRAGRSPGRSRLRRELPVHAHGRSCRPPRTPGRSSST